MKGKMKMLYQKASQFMQKEYDGILLFVGLTMLFYLCLNLVRAQYIYNNTITPKYRYSKEFALEGYWTEDMLNDISEWFEERGCNCTIRCLGGKVGNSLEVGEMLVYLSAEGISRKENIDLAKWNEKENAVLLDGGLSKFIYKSHGKKRILINDLEYDVYDVINEGELLGHSSYVYWKNLDKEHREIITKALQEEEKKGVESRLTLQIESLTRFSEELEDFLMAYENRFHERFNFQGAFDKSRKYLVVKIEAFYGLMFIMGICSLQFIVDLWVLRRKREMMIRRMLGFSYLRLFITLMRETAWITLFSFLTALMLEMRKIGFSTASSFVWYEMIIALFCSLVISVIVEMMLIALQTIKIIKTNPTQENLETAGE